MARPSTTPRQGPDAAPGKLGGIVLETGLSAPFTGAASPSFCDRRQAGRRLAEELDQRGLEADVVVAIRQRVLVVDDGVATGATTRAALREVRARGARRAILAVPVGAPSSIGELRSEADEVVSLATPSTFGAVGQFYERFDQVADGDAIAIPEATR